MEDEQARAEVRRRRVAGHDGKTPVIFFDSATANMTGDEIFLRLDCTGRDPSDPDKSPVRHLRTRLEGAKALRAALDQEIARLEGGEPKVWRHPAHGAAEGLEGRIYDQDQPAPGDEAAEMRLRVVITIFGNGALWPADGTRPDVVRGSMAAEVQATVEDAIDDALALCTELKDLGLGGRTYVLKADVRDWLNARSTVPASDGLSNADRLFQAFRAADAGKFRPNEFGMLWQQLRTKPEYR